MKTCLPNKSLDAQKKKNFASTDTFRHRCSWITGLTSYPISSHSISNADSIILKCLSLLELSHTTVPKHQVFECKIT